ncbi:hypothetical protein [Clavibacter michiganensis]|uniref:hypothetical protein n=1 Tax=Clavibacter michiganensis TaxID=28447 RepID=UPI000B1B730C|nr:hypothetical protein [Clavibacter michiganensis]AWF99845.1 hypothetical protein BEH61_15165 [Clavibacter michiganensis subsp. insidiosus]AWG02949.1 hypothetical protein BEH62_15250 [Clavibacter michiganensis subsp. insidiosus]
MNKVRSSIAGLVRDVGAHPWAHLEAGYWRIQVEDRPVLGYVMRARAELGDPFTFEVYADARNELGQRIWLRREESLNSAAAWMIQNSDRLIAFAARHAAAPAAADVAELREPGDVGADRLPDGYEVVDLHGRARRLPAG